jgi:hypothetical protein
MCMSTVAIVAPQKQSHAADLWDSPFSLRRSAGTSSPRTSPAAGYAYFSDLPLRPLWPVGEIRLRGLMGVLK